MRILCPIKRQIKHPTHLHTHLSLNLLKTRTDNDRLSEKRRHALVHQRVRLDEIQRQIGQGAAVVVALTGSRIGHLGTLHGQPVGIDGSLLLEVALERIGDVL